MRDAVGFWTCCDAVIPVSISSFLRAHTTLKYLALLWPPLLAVFILQKGGSIPFSTLRAESGQLKVSSFSANREPITNLLQRVFVTESVVINLRMSAVHLKHEKPCRLLVEHTRILLKSIEHTTEEKQKNVLKRHCSSAILVWVAESCSHEPTRLHNQIAISFSKVSLLFVTLSVPFRAD